ncbi:MAG: serine protease [Bacteroidia bacterium]|nr:serine protease [Bacteroidia bacterium]
MTELKNIVGKFKCGDDSYGTAFLVAPDIVITAYHVYNGKTPIVFDFVAISEMNVSGKYIDGDEEKDICLIRLDKEIKVNLFPLKIGRLFKNNEWETYGFPTELSACNDTNDSFITNSQGENFSGTILQIISEKAHRNADDKHWDTSLNVKDKNIDSYRGLSGAPLVVSDSIVGFIIVQASKMLWAVSFDSVIGILLKNNIFLEELSYTEFAHDFRIDKDIHPNELSLKRLNDVINTIQRGYIFLQGAPGTGKSTLLSHWIRIRSERIIKYYAYIHNENNSNRRGEANIFLYDLIVQLRENGFGKQEKLDKNVNVQELERILESQLNELKEDFENNGRKTIILVDGLDHVPREYATEKSFLRQLPQPDAIPNGIIFVLGSQKYLLEGISEAIKRSMNENNAIEIAALEKSHIYQIIDAYKVENISEYKKAIADKCAGNPLYLRYLMQKIVDSPNNIGENIENMPTYSGDIEDLYQKYWDEIVNANELQRILGLFARLKGTINLTFVEEWDIISQEIVAEFSKNAKHFFNESKNEKRIDFFHNSFKQFILQKTREKSTFTGVAVDYSKDEWYHKRLADYCEKTDTINKWDILYHFYAIGDYEKIKQIATREYFEAQLLAFRPIPDIIEDIQLALSFAVRKRDLVAMARCILIATEYGSREFYGKSEQIIHKLIDLGEHNNAIGYIREGNRFKSLGNGERNYAFVLEVALRLWQNGNEVEAQKLYYMAEPLELLNYPIQSDYRRDLREIAELLYIWVRVAGVLFEAEEVIQKIEGIEWQNHKEEDIEGIYHNLLYSLGDEYIVNKELDKLEVLVDYLEQKELRFWIKLRIYQIDLLKDEDASRAKVILGELLTKTDVNSLRDNTRVELAYIIFNLNEDKALITTLIENVSIPLSEGCYELSESKDYKDRLWLYCLQYFIGNEVAIGEFPQKRESDRDKEELVVLQIFEEKLTQLAQLTANACQKIYEPQALLWAKYAHSFLSLFYTDFGRLGYSLKEPTHWVLKSFIQIVSMYEDKDFYFLFEKFKEEWKRQPKKWHFSLIKELLMEFYHNGISAEEIEIYLESIIDKHYEVFSNTDERIEDALKNVEYYLVLGKQEKAKCWLSIALKDSFGIGYRKDYQMNEWIEWIERFASVCPEQRIELTQWISARLPYMKKATEGPAFYRSIELLTENTFKHNLSLGWQLLLWQWDKGYINFETGFSIFLENISEKIITTEELSVVYQLFERVLLPISKGSHTKLLEIITEKYIYFASCLEYSTNITQIVESIAIFALPTTRKDYYLSIRGICDKRGIHIDSIKELNELDLGKEDDFSEIAEKQEIFGNRTKEQLLKAIDESNSYGWFRYYDGGTRINPLEKLILLDKDCGRKKAFNLLKLDLKRHHYDFSTHIYEIFSILIDNLPIKELWVEIKSYLNRMFENAVLVVDVPYLKDKHQSHSILLRECIEYLSMHPITFISLETQSIIAKEITPKNTTFTQLVKDWLLAEEKLQIFATQILTSVSIKNPDLIKVFEHELLNLTQTPHFQIYHLACSLLILCEAPEDQLKRKYSPLPLIYQVEISEPVFKDETVNKELPTQAIPDSEDPYMVIKPMDIYLEFIEKLLGLNIDVLVNRVYRLMTQLHQKHEWQFEYENNIRLKMSAIDLNYAYTRPRCKIAERALNYLLMEFYDSGYEIPMNIFTFFNRFSPWIKPQKRPKYVPFIVEENQNRFSLPSDWVNEMEKNEEMLKSSIFFQIEDGKFIIAEYSHLSALEWGKPYEIRQSVWTYKNKVDFGMLMNGVFLDSKDIVCQNHANYSTSGYNSHYLVLNPELGEFLGWNNGDNYFQWRNKKGEIMVESIYWTDGNISIPPYLDCEVGEGWLVVASEKAVTEIKTVYQVAFIQHAKIERSKENKINSITFSK